MAEVKCILTGARISEYLDFRVLLAKIVGLIGTISSGFPMGRCGPMIHIGAMISFNLAKLNFFKNIKEDSVLKIQSITIGAAVGMSVAWGTPIAGI